MNLSFGPGDIFCLVGMLCYGVHMAVSYGFSDCSRQASRLCHLICIAMSSDDGDVSMDGGEGKKPLIFFVIIFDCIIFAHSNKNNVNEEENIYVIPFFIRISV